MVSIFENKNILGIIGIVLILIVIIFVFRNFNLNKNISNEEKIIKPSFNQIIDEGNISNCKNIEEEYLIESCKLKLENCTTDDCYFKKGRVNLNESVCFKIVDENLRISCTAAIKYDSIIQGAVIKNDISICTQLDTQINIEKCNNNFYYANAINKADKSFCNKIINNLEVKNECIKY